MNKFETAYLAQQQYVMLQNQHSAIASYLGMVMLTIFGYIVLAYLIGYRLTVTQSRIVTATYVAWQGYLTLELYASIEVSKIIALRFVALSPTNPPQRLVDYYVGDGLDNVRYSLILLALLGSLYFMWLARHRAGQKPAETVDRA